jgi:hypothetical protein
MLHELGECEFKHGVRLFIVNLYTAELGNFAVPEKLKRRSESPAQTATAGAVKPTRLPWPKVVIALLVVAALIGSVILFLQRPARAKPLRPLPHQHSQPFARKASRCFHSKI